MKRKWTKPELYVEEFELSQHVAAGCGTTTDVIIDEKILADYAGCSQSNGNGHWGADNVTIYDSNKNGVVDWEEFVEAVGAAYNGNQTGSGHYSHGLVIKLPGKEEITVIPLNS